MKRSILICLLAAMLVLLVGCGKPAGNANNADAGNQEVAMADGVALPETYPAELVPLYPGSTCTSAVSTGTVADEQYQYTVVLSTKDSLETVQKFYEEKLGATLDGTMPINVADGAVMVNGNKGDVQAGVTITKGAEDGTSVAIAIIKQ